MTAVLGVIAARKQNGTHARNRPGPGSFSQQGRGASLRLGG
jgi:hypothetical protein